MVRWPSCPCGDVRRRSCSSPEALTGGKAVPRSAPKAQAWGLCIEKPAKSPGPWSHGIKNAQAGTIHLRPRLIFSIQSRQDRGKQQSMKEKNKWKEKEIPKGIGNMAAYSNLLSCKLIFLNVKRMTRRPLMKCIHLVSFKWLARFGRIGTELLMMGEPIKRHIIKHNHFKHHWQGCIMNSTRGETGWDTDYD